MPQGQHLLKIGTRREIHVNHTRSPFEVALTDTDAAMTISTATAPAARSGTVAKVGGWGGAVSGQTGRRDTAGTLMSWQRKANLTLAGMGVVALAQR